MVKGPDPIGNALRITAECDHSGGIEKTWNAMTAVTAGCRTSFIDTSRAIERISPVTTRSCARNNPMQTSAAGEAAPPSRVVKLRNGAGTVRLLRPTARPATGAMKSGLVKIARATLAPVDQKLLPF